MRKTHNGPFLVHRCTAGGFGEGGVVPPSVLKGPSPPRDGPSAPRGVARRPATINGRATNMDDKVDAFDAFETDRNTLLKEAKPLSKLADKFETGPRVGKSEGGGGQGDEGGDGLNDVADAISDGCFAN